MYKYSDKDKKIIASRVKLFENQVNRRLEGKLTEEEFKPLRLMNGLKSFSQKSWTCLEGLMLSWI